MISICPEGPTGSPTRPSDNNPSYSHREAGDGACGFDLGTTHACKQSNVNLCGELFKILCLIAKHSIYLNQVVMCDKTWYITMIISLRGKSEHWKRKNEPWEKKVLQQMLLVKVILIVFLDHRSYLYPHFVLSKMAINKKYYPKS